MRKPLVAWAIIAAVAGAMFGVEASAQTTRAKSKLTVKETPMGKLGAPGDTRSMAVSSDGNHVAVVSKKGNKYFVTRDGVAGKEYDWIVASSITFTADRQHLAYVVQQDNKMFVVMDDKEGKKYQEIMNADVFVARAGAAVGYCAKAAANGKRFYVINEEEGKEYDLVFAFSFSPDGKRWAYGVESGGKQYFMVDGAPTKEYEKVAGTSFVWSPDSKHFAHAAVMDKKVVMIVDGKEQGTCEEMSRLVFSPDSAHVAYSARTGEDVTVILDGKPLKKYGRVSGESIRFSPDNAKLVYMASRKETVKDKDGKDQITEKLLYVVGEEEMRPYPGLVNGAFIFSPDSKRTAYVAITAGAAGARAVVVVDGIEGKDYEDIRLLQFSPDSKRLAYLGKRENRAYAVVDNSEGLGYQTVGNLVFSKDGKRMAYVAGRDKYAFVVLDNIEGKNYVAVVPETLTFSADGKHLVYQAQREGAQPILVVDGEETGEFTGTLRGSAPVFDGDNAVRALILRDAPGGDPAKGSDIIRMQVTIGE